MIQKLLNSEEVGYYSVAVSLGLIFPLITSSLTATILPKLDSYLKNNSINDYIKIIMKKSVYVIVLLSLCILISPIMIEIFFGSVYSGSILVFQILLIGHAINIIINPISLVLYKINKAHIATISNFIQLPINVFANLLLIPTFGIIGAATSTVFIYIFNGIFIVLYLKIYSSKEFK